MRRGSVPTQRTCPQPKSTGERPRRRLVLSPAARAPQRREPGVVLLWRPTPWRRLMSSTSESTESAAGVPEVGTVDMKLEVVTVPVSDVDRAKRFYQSLGWRLDADFSAGEA